MLGALSRCCMHFGCGLRLVAADAWEPCSEIENAFPSVPKRVSSDFYLTQHVVLSLAYWF
jgi:hypothetical protein